MIPNKRREMQNFVDEKSGTWEEVPAGAFRESGTEVRTGILVLQFGLLPE